MNPVSWSQMSRNWNEIMKRLDRAVKKISERRQGRRIVSPSKVIRASPPGLLRVLKLPLSDPIQRYRVLKKHCQKAKSGLDPLFSYSLPLHEAIRNLFSRLF
jgi:hypothetical protein